MQPPMRVCLCSGAYAGAYACDYACRLAGVAYAMPTHKHCVLHVRFMKSSHLIEPTMRMTQTIASTDSHHYRYLTNEKGEKEAIILPIDEYEDLLEDIEDLAVVLERRGEPTIPFEEVKKRLKEDGLL